VQGLWGDAWGAEAETQAEVTATNEQRLMWSTRAVAAEQDTWDQTTENAR
jgi:hypothetical protein